MWTYQGKTISEEEIPKEAYGFIYKIVNKKTKRFYIGKKALAFKRKKKLTKVEKLLPENKRKTYKFVTTESGWQNYFGSCKELIQDVKDLGENVFIREILEFCTDKKSLTYREVWNQFKYNVLEADSYNGNILSRFFKPK